MNQQIIMFKNMQRERQNTKEITNQKTTQLALAIKMYKIRTNMNKLPSEQKVWAQCIQNKEGENRKKTTIHITEIAKAIKVFQKSGSKNNQPLTHAAQMPTLTPQMYAQEHSTEKGRRHNWR